MRSRATAGDDPHSLLFGDEDDGDGDQPRPRPAPNARRRRATSTRTAARPHAAAAGCSCCSRVVHRRRVAYLRRPAGDRLLLGRRLLRAGHRAGVGHGQRRRQHPETSATPCRRPGRRQERAGLHRRVRRQQVREHPARQLQAAAAHVRRRRGRADPVHAARDATNDLVDPGGRHQPRRAGPAGRRSSPGQGGRDRRRAEGRRGTSACRAATPARAAASPTSVEGFLYPATYRVDPSGTPDEAAAASGPALPRAGPADRLRRRRGQDPPDAVRRADHRLDRAVRGQVHRPTCPRSCARS